MAFVTFMLLYFRFDPELIKITKRKADFLEKNDAIAALINGSGKNNIPALNI